MAKTLGPAKVVFACVANAGRSQMASAFFNKFANPKRAFAVSAGTRPAQAVHAEVVAAMREIGVDLSQAKPEYLSSDVCKGAHILITMGCGDQCPLVPGVERDEWTIDDPQGKPPQTVRLIRDQIKKFVTDLIRERRW